MWRVSVTYQTIVNDRCRGGGLYSMRWGNLHHRYSWRGSAHQRTSQRQPVCVWVWVGVDGWVCVRVGGGSVCVCVCACEGKNSCPLFTLSIVSMETLLMPLLKYCCLVSAHDFLSHAVSAARCSSPQLTLPSPASANTASYCLWVYAWHAQYKSAVLRCSKQSLI